MSDPLANIGNRSTSQNQPATPTQVQNNAGGFVFETSDEQKLLRFLVLGTTGGTYYQREAQFTAQVTAEMKLVMNSLGERFVEIIREVSLEGRAPKQQPTLWALAMAATASFADGSPNHEIRQAAYHAIGDVCRTGTMLFGFMSYSRNFLGGNGRGFRKAVARWYTEREVDALSRQIAKYGQREGFSHRDVLRLTHPKAPSAAHNEVFRFAVTGENPPEGLQLHRLSAPPTLTRL
jgi:60 kDa SS-A/Ro ribonucleoprotein